MIILSTISIILSTHGDLVAKKDVFLALDDFCAAFFTIDIAFRLFGYRRRLLYFRSWLNIVDLIAVIPFYIALIGNGGDFSTQILRFMRLARVLSLLKLVRHLGILEVLKDTIAGSVQGLALLLLIVVISATLFATFMFLIEQGIEDASGKMIREDGSESPYTSIPVSIYWAITTFTTVGYGDITPVSIEGRVLAAVAMIFGVIFFALPLAIMSNAFNEAWEKHKKAKGRKFSFLRDHGEADASGHHLTPLENSEMIELVSKFKEKHEEYLSDFEKLLELLSAHKDASTNVHVHYGNVFKDTIKAQMLAYTTSLEQSLHH
jgi:voltage-gated potassium channel Kch